MDGHDPRNNGLDHVLVSQGTRDMAKRPESKVRFKNYSEERDKLTTERLALEGALRTLREREEALKTETFDRRRREPYSVAGFAWARVREKEIEPERRRLTGRLAEVVARLREIKPKVQRERALTDSELFTADGRVNYERAFLEILGHVKKIRVQLQRIQERLAALESRASLP